MIGFDYGHLWEWEEFDPCRLLEVMGDFDAPPGGSPEAGRSISGWSARPGLTKTWM